MTVQTVCDSCGEPIDTEAGYVAAGVTILGATHGQQEPGPPEQISRHWHTEHVPAGLVPEPEPKK